jgi:hypothetical protein
MPEDDWPLFARPVPMQLRQLANAVHNLAISETEGDRALPINLIYDHRVSPERAKHFLAFIHKRLGVIPVSIEALQNALASYKRELVAGAPGETFGEPPEKSKNHIAESKDLVHVCNLTQKLIHITNSVLMTSEVRKALQRLRIGARALVSAGAVDQLLQPRLRDSLQKRDFVVDFLNLVGKYRRIAPWNPVWAVTWEHFEHACANAAPSGWLESVGLQCSSGPEWLLLLRYPSDQAGLLYRPTQLEAGSLAFHFPSPDCAELDRGGHPVHFGRHASPDRGLISEFVHAEFDFSVDHWIAGGSLLERAAPNSYRALASYRKGHHDLLCSQYGEKNVTAWMRYPNKMPHRAFEQLVDQAQVP